MLQESAKNNYTIITDASCFILLDKIDALEILRLLNENILTTPEIALEFGKSLPYWVKVVPVKAIHLVVEYLHKVDLGEATAIALAQETPNAIMILDDFKGRKLANQLQMKFTGTIGVLMESRRQKTIPSLRPYFDLIKLTDFRIDHDLLNRVLDDFQD